MKARVKPYLAALAAAAIVFGIVLFFEWSEHKRLNQELRADALHELSNVRSSLEFAVNSRLMPVEGLSFYISTNPGISRDEFDEFAGQIMDRQKGIHSIEIVKGTVITNYIYPFKGNEKAIGLDLMSMPAERETVQRAIATRKTVVAGPVDLVQGGVAFISRSPIFISSGKGLRQRDKYWGLTQAVIITDTVFTEAGLYDKTAFRLAIRGKDATGASGEIFFGDKKVFRETPMLLDATLFSGSWQLAVVPVRGWAAVPRSIWILRIVGAILSILTGILAWILVRNPILLKEKVEQATKALRETQREMQRPKEDIETTERRRLARELHDSVGQSLLAVKLSLQMMKAGKIPATGAAVEELIRDVSNITGEIRGIVMNLRPPFMEKDDIINTVRQLSSRMQDKTGVEITVDAGDNFTGFDSSVRYNIYRICQEVLNNAVKHSGAGRIGIKFAMAGKVMSVEINDNGKGFDPRAAKERRRGSGLTIMAERVEFLRGAFNIRTAQGEGTSIHITVPVHD